MLKYRELEAKEEAEMDYLLSTNSAVLKLRVISGKYKDVEVNKITDEAIRLIEENDLLSAAEQIPNLKTLTAVKDCDIDISKLIDGIISVIKHAHDTSIAYDSFYGEDQV
ncbi:hypothetical protein M2277_005031 [Paenibacillus sp. LBL]|uniref:hypothetical protein n=1 Tax=Paenibacillus sp. LBL TaxID=2940563 RepID=UPI002475DFE3|nr:hypothetical protein [Paenibacillus sp. LBL]MDH6674339.1 hypothetical protein [Paenibacillus sp. LBL]